MFQVRIAHLSHGIHQETERPTADDLGLDPEVFSDVAVDVTLDVADRRILAAFTASATAQLTCDRTLEPYDEHVSGDHAVVFSADTPPDGEEVFELAGDAQTLDLTAPVYDTLMLALPLRRVSPAAEDADIPTAFGGPSADEPADDRWAALKALRDNDSA